MNEEKEEPYKTIYRKDGSKKKEYYDMEGGKSMVAKYDKDEELKRTKVKRSGLLNKGSISPIMAKCGSYRHSGKK
jgi:hypothetical protein